MLSFSNFGASSGRSRPRPSAGADTTRKPSRTLRRPGGTLTSQGESPSTSGQGKPTGPIFFGTAASFLSGSNRPLGAGTSNGGAAGLTARHTSARRRIRHSLRVTGWPLPQAISRSGESPSVGDAAIGRVQQAVFWMARHATLWPGAAPPARNPGTHVAKPGTVPPGAGWRISPQVMASRAVETRWPAAQALIPVCPCGPSAGFPPAIRRGHSSQRNPGEGPWATGWPSSPFSLHASTPFWLQITCL